MSVLESTGENLLQALKKENSCLFPFLYYLCSKPPSVYVVNQSIKSISNVRLNRIIHLKKQNIMNTIKSSLMLILYVLSDSKCII